MIGRLIALVVSALIILIAAIYATGVSPVEALQTLLKGSLGSPGAIAGTLRETTPLLIAGIAVFVALRAGLFNIGVEGQLLVGALAATGVALAVPGAIGLVLAVLAGMLGGALWAIPAGWIRAYRNGHEVITTIMLNNVALLLTGWFVAGPLRDSTQQSPTTHSVGTMLPDLYRHSPLVVSLALIVGIALAVLLAWWLKRTVSGYELEAVGGNPTAAQWAGISAKKVMVRSMAASGAIGGLAGAMQVLAYEGRFYSGFSPGYGFDALGVALLAGSNPIGMLPGSLLFGMLAKGGTSLQIEGVPKGIATVVLGLLILIAAAIRYRKVKTVA